MQFFSIGNLIGLAIILLWGISFRFAYKLPISKPNNILDNKTRLRRSVISGFVLTTFWLSIIILGFILDQETSFSFAGLGGVLCLVLPFQIIVTFGSYNYYWGTKRLYEWIGKGVEKLYQFGIKPPKP